MPFSLRLAYSLLYDTRYKKMEPTLRYIAESFRCYTEGLNLSDDLYTAFDD